MSTPRSHADDHQEPELPTTSRALATGFAGLGLSVALAGCAAPDAGADADTSASYADGEYTAGGGYQAPSGAESVTVTVTLADDIVTAVEVAGDASDPQARGFQEAFAGGIAGEVVGRDIDTLSVSRVAGSSLTSSGFNQAIAAIKAEALES